MHELKLFLLAHVYCFKAQWGLKLAKFYIIAFKYFGARIFADLAVKTMHWGHEQITKAGDCRKEIHDAIQVSR